MLAGSPAPAPTPMPPAPSDCREFSVVGAGADAANGKYQLVSVPSEATHPVFRQTGKPLAEAYTLSQPSATSQWMIGLSERTPSYTAVQTAGMALPPPNASWHSLDSPVGKNTSSALLSHHVTTSMYDLYSD
jgi:hypothetical protein